MGNLQTSWNNRGFANSQYAILPSSSARDFNDCSTERMSSARRSLTNFAHCRISSSEVFVEVIASCRRFRTGSISGNKKVTLSEN